MKLQPLLIVLTVVDFIMMLFSPAQTREAGAQAVVSVRRGRALGNRG